MTTATHMTADDRNPLYALQTLSGEVLQMAARGEIDLNELARAELASRGVDEDGKWVGWNRTTKTNCRKAIQRTRAA